MGMLSRAATTGDDIPASSEELTAIAGVEKVSL